MVKDLQKRRYDRFVGGMKEMNIQPDYVHLMELSKERVQFICSRQNED